MNSLDFFNSLQQPQLRNKYEVASHYYKFNYKIISGTQAYYLDIPPLVKQFIMEHGEVIALPNMFNGKVYGMLLRPIFTKTFRYYSNVFLPYGAGVNNKPYNKPWVIVESCLDADFLRQFYPYVIATLGASISNSLLEFLFETAPYVVSGMDNDDAGEAAFKKLCYSYKGRVKKLKPPNGNKDFGETLDLLVKHDFSNFEFESLMIQTSLLPFKD